jgi:hypothetical protein
MPSTDWGQAGPIVEREKIMVAWNEGDWIAGVTAHVEGPAGHLSKGPTALIAPMRAFVTSQLGGDVAYFGERDRRFRERDRFERSMLSCVE